MRAHRKVNLAAQRKQRVDDDWGFSMDDNTAGDDGGGGGGGDENSGGRAWQILLATSQYAFYSRNKG